jgi:hypothetical protein
MSIFALVIAGAFVAASCTGGTVSTGSTDTTESVSVTTAVGGETATTPPTDGPDDSTPPSSVAVEDQVVVLDGADLVAPEENWNKIEETFFVWGVESGDVLNVRSGPGINNPIVATIAPGSGGLSVYDTIDVVGNSNWVPIEITADGRGGWASNRFLRPDPPADGPTVQGSSSAEVLALVEQTLASLGDADALAELVGSEGLTLSPSAYVGDDAVTLTQSQITNAADADRVWGVTAGKGDEIVATLDQYLEGLRGRSAITSTAEIGYDVALGGGNSINNLAEVFPDATVVEYYHPGTSFYGGLDWSALRFVFDTDGDQLVLRGLISDQWEI